MLAHHLTSTLLAAATKNNGNGYGTLVLLVLVVLAFVLFTRSQRSKQRRMLEQRKSITVGAEVVTTAGLIAHVVDMDDETVTLEIAPGVHSKFLRQAVVRVVEETGADDAAAGEPTAEDTAPDDTAPDRTG
ncbi:MAG: preprotein translocase subunit YajC [Frankiaceae bacterium]|nr:preprotein translocase subunit YajC [Frankiaceae bacterium]